MKKAIYKIENLINHKIYIGQSKDPNYRFQQHCFKRQKYRSLINQAINKYGKENFSLEILGWFEDYNEKEKEYIKKYRCLAPYGYNIALGGDSPPILKGKDNPNTTITEETANKIIEQLLDWKIPRKTIVANNKVTQDIIRHINEGHAWKKDNITYPIRPQEKILNEYRATYIKWMCCTSDLPLNQLGALVGWGKSSAKMINQGDNHYDNRLKYPIRTYKEYNKSILSQETCIDYLHFGE